MFLRSRRPQRPWLLLPRARARSRSLRMGGSASISGCASGGPRCFSTRTDNQSMPAPCNSSRSGAALGLTRASTSRDRNAGPSCDCAASCKRRSACNVGTTGWISSIPQCPRRVKTIPATGTNSSTGSAARSGALRTWSDCAGRRGSCARAAARAGDPYRSSRSRLMCRSCSHQSTVTAGTIFDKTRTPLRVWLAGSVVSDEPEARRQRPGAAAGAGAGWLRDSLDDAAPLPSRHGPPGP